MIVQTQNPFQQETENNEESESSPNYFLIFIAIAVFLGAVYFSAKAIKKI